MKQKMREKVRPKMGKIDIDYQKLHDAFFRWQTKPKLTQHGDLYYEVRVRLFKMFKIFENSEKFENLMIFEESDCISCMNIAKIFKISKKF